MFKKTDRLTTREFGVAWKQSKTKYCGKAAIFKQVVRVTGPKLAVVVGKKVARNAVDRNRLKRLVFARLKRAVLAQNKSCIVIVKLADEKNLVKELVEIEKLL